MPMAGMTRTAVVFVLIHADGRLVGDHRGKNLSRRIAGNNDHIQPYAANSGHGFEFFKRQDTLFRRLNHARVLADRDERTGKASTDPLAMTPPFFTASLSIASAAVVPYAPTVSSPMASSTSAILSPTAGVGARGQIDNAERHPERFARDLAHKLPHARDLKRCPLDDLGNTGQIKAFGIVKQSASHSSRPGYAEVNDYIRLARTVERTCHKGVVLRRVAKYNQLRRANAIAVNCPPGGI